MTTTSDYQHDHDDHQDHDERGGRAMNWRARFTNNNGATPEPTTGPDTATDGSAGRVPAPRFRSPFPSGPINPDAARDTPDDDPGAPGVPAIPPGPTSGPGGGGSSGAVAIPLPRRGGHPTDTTPDGGADTIPDAGPDNTADSAPDGEAFESGADVDAFVRDSRQAVSGRVDVLPSWLKDRASLLGLVRERADRAWRITAFHALRAPVYWVRLAGRSPVGLGRVVRWCWDWTTDAHGRRVGREVALGTHGQGAHEAMAYHRVIEQNRERVRNRLIVAAVLALLAAVALVGVVVGAPATVKTPALLVALAVLGVLGRKQDQAIIPSATVAAGLAPRLDSRLITTALGALGVAALNRGLKEEGIGFAGPIHRDGPGWRADIDLPAGVPAGDVIERRDRLAAGLRRPVACVWPEPDPDAHEARLILWVGDQAMNKAKTHPWPLATRGTVDLFDSFVMGLDQRGRPVTVCLMFASMVIGATVRMGKTFTLRLLLLAAALDVRTELHVHNLKGGVDLRPLALVAHRYRIGDTDDDVAYLLEDVKALVAEMSRRYTVLDTLSEDECPEGKITPQLANRRSLGLHPIVLAADECQYAFENDTHGKAIEKALTDLAKRGPAVGIIVILATQRPDAKSIPPGISSNAVLRFCLKVAGQVENDMVLGTSAYKSGNRATMFARTDYGTGILAGEGDTPRIVRTDYVDGALAKTIARRARALRLAAGTLTGYAADLDHTPAHAEDDGPTLLDDLAAVLHPGDGKVRSEDLLARLVEYRPEVYDGWTTSDLGNAVKPFGLDTVQVNRRENGRAVNRRGLDAAHVHQAITQRDSSRGGTAA